MAYEKKLIEGNFPCQQVGAETKRERGASSSLPPLYFLHVWWARRPLTPSRAAVLGSILPADVAPDEFLKELGIVKKQAVVGGQCWTLVGKNLTLIDKDDSGEFIYYSADYQKALDKENKRRTAVREYLRKLCDSDPSFSEDTLVKTWMSENTPIPVELMVLTRIPVITVPANPAHINERIAFAASDRVIEILGEPIKIDPEDMYGYGRAYETPIHTEYNHITILDPTAGGGSIPFEAMRLGCNIIANDLNPVATGIEIATLNYPTRFGKELLPYLDHYGSQLEKTVSTKTKTFFNFERPIGAGAIALKEQCGGQQELFERFNVPEYDQQGLLFCREVTCPSCKEKTPLLNAYALSKKADGWMVLPKVEGMHGNKKIRLVPTKLVKGKGPNGEDPEVGSVYLGTGTCLHCGQAIDREEIKRQARGESSLGKWSNRLFCIVGVREQPKLGKDGKVMVYATGPNKGQVRTERVSFFREPTENDQEALERAEKALKENWSHWEEMGLIPSERIPVGYNTAQPLSFGMEYWQQMFTPRQLLCHLTAIESLHNMAPQIIADTGKEKGIAIIHYLQYMIDKCLDYNSVQTRWEYTRGVIKGTFGRHDFGPKWSFGEMISTGPNSGLKWAKSQIMDAYEGMCSLVGKNNSNLTILHGSASNLSIPSKSVDVICVDPPYYNNVEYAELSDFFYVWEKIILKEYYPELFSRRLTNKQDEAVANPIRSGSIEKADLDYEKIMGEIFFECRRVLRDDGIMTMMFTHKTQEAWETLTKALMENGWIISSAFPVDSEGSSTIYQIDKAAAASSIFLACRKRDMADRQPAAWRGFGGTGVQQQLRQAVRQSLRNYEVLHLNAVDEMVASYGSALKVLSENWPVMDGDELVSPITAMREASTIVAQYQMTKLTDGRLSVEDIAPEAGVAVTLFGIYGTGYLPFDDALSLSKSLNIRLEHKAAGYRDEGRMIGINDEKTGRTRNDDDTEGYFAPLVKKGSKLRLALPEERNERRLQEPQNEWDIMQGVIMAYREGDIPVARAYLQRQAAGHEDKVIAVLRVWADGCDNEALTKEARRILFGLNEGK